MRSFVWKEGGIPNKYGVPLIFLRGAFGLGQQQVEHHTDDGGKTDARHGEVAGREHGTANAHCECDGDDNHVACLVHVHFMMDEILYPDTGYRTEKQQHDAAQNGLWNGLE